MPMENMPDDKKPAKVFCGLTLLKGYKDIQNL